MKRTTKRTKAKKTKRRIPLAKPATRKRAARIVGRAGGYATAKKRARHKRGNVYILAGRKVSRARR
ncbi:hypothetical protein Ga0100231_005390 [Opitutaceae bacterium TAV4]|nr:hypothetical protein Ga0100231_005390 [Opitutaceae bacterium TAV4]RRK02597.1 hypothetical protein Ga0100230_005640 [Opitutaceae bacterium TAV3]